MKFYCKHLMQLLLLANVVWLQVLPTTMAPLKNPTNLNSTSSFLEGVELSLWVQL